MQTAGGRAGDTVSCQYFVDKVLFTICLVQQPSLERLASYVYYVSALHTSAIFPRRRSSIFLCRTIPLQRPAKYELWMCTCTWLNTRKRCSRERATDLQFCEFNQPAWRGILENKIKSEGKSRCAPSRPPLWWFNLCSAHFLSLHQQSFCSERMDMD